METAISMKGLFRISRPINLLMVALAQFMAAYFLVVTNQNGDSVIFDAKLYILIFSTVIITAAGYMINDYYDVKIDYVNRPDEVIVGRSIKRRIIILLHTFLNFLGIGLGYIVSPKVALVNFLAAFLLWLYSNELKRRPLVGNITVALLTALAIFLVGIYYEKSQLLIFTYAVFAFYLNLIREIIKDIEDRPGDRKHGCRTLPIVIGFRKTKEVIFVIALCFIISIVLITLSLNQKELYLYFGGLAFFFLYFLYKIYVGDRREHFTMLSKYAKILMLIGTLSMAFL